MKDQIHFNPFRRGRLLLRKFFYSKPFDLNLISIDRKSQGK